MHMELEFDDNALNSRGKAYRLKNYMSAFKKHGIWEKKRLAYYQGSASLLALKNQGTQPIPSSIMSSVSLSSAAPSGVHISINSLIITIL